MKEYLKFDYSALPLCLFLFALLCGNYIVSSDALMYVFLLIMTIYVIMVAPNKTLKVMVFLAPFASIIQTNDIIVGFIINVFFSIKVFIDYKKIEIMPFFSFLGFIFVAILGYNMGNNVLPNARVLITVAYLFTAYSAKVVIEKNKKDAEIYFIYFLVGFLSSSFVGIFVDDIPKLELLINNDIIWTEDFKTISRFSGIAFDCNFYGFICAVCMAIIASTYQFSHYKKFYFFASIAIFLFGMTTLSKMFLLTCIFCIIFYGIYKFEISIEKLGYFFIFLLLFYFFITNIDFDILEIYYLRVLNTDSDINSFTTGRYDLWLTYFNEINYDLKSFLLGYGINDNHMYKAAHNTYLEVWEKTGVLGLLFFVMYLISCSSITYKITIYKMPMLIFFLLLNGLSAFTFLQLWILIIFVNISEIIAEGS